MSKAVRPTADAEGEFRYYIQWYERQTPGLGDRLWSEIQASINLISTHPTIGELLRRVRVRGVVRRVPLRRFPFFLVYRDHEDHVEIVALAHTSRKPNYWRARLT